MMANEGRTILVTGATGKQGGAVAAQLLGHGYDVRAMTRKPDGEAARGLREQGATVVQGDLDDAASLERALADAWGVLAIQNTWEAGVEREEEQGKRLARLARAAGVHHFVYHSVASADRNTGIPHFDNKYRIEQTILSLDFPSWTIVRPVFFMENVLLPAFKQGIDQGVLAMGIKAETPLQMIAVDDIGKYGFLAFERWEAVNGRAIDIAGDALTPAETARILTDVTGRQVVYHEIPIEEVRSFSEDYATMYEWFDAVGYDADMEGNAREFGIPPTRFREWAAAQDWS
jgi:uncharacterized protein YbjT (DUF2867 family)